MIELFSWFWFCAKDSVATGTSSRVNNRCIVGIVMFVLLMCRKMVYFVIIALKSMHNVKGNN